jgi:hypothetical protein
MNDGRRGGAMEEGMLAESSRNGLSGVAGGSDSRRAPERELA